KMADFLAFNYIPLRSVFPLDALENYALQLGTYFYDNYLTQKNGAALQDLFTQTIWPYLLNLEDVDLFNNPFSSINYYLKSVADSSPLKFESLDREAMEILSLLDSSING
ncbi:unnamed protein product, partial [Meganyctiphanes norvegica]